MRLKHSVARSPDFGLIARWYNQSYTTNNENGDLDPR
jgi:hypothetical protein